jgi:hypothetical protein
VIAFPGDEAFGAICPDADNVDWNGFLHTGKATRDINVGQVQMEAVLLQGQKVTANKIASSVSPN